jgi:thiamine biosynthesis lipoprotein
MSRIPLTAACIPLLFFSFCSGPRTHFRQFFAFDTLIAITLSGCDNATARHAIDTLVSIASDLERRYSISDTNSEIFKINNRSDSTVRISPELDTLLRFCEKQWKESGGLFDVTVGPLKSLYGLGSHDSANRVPTASELDSVRGLIGFGRMRFAGDSALVLQKGLRLDLGGIVKGFYLARVRETLDGLGIRNSLVNAGGDLCASGARPDGGPWVIGIKDPRRSDSLLGVLRVSGKAVFTSGDYERFFIADGVRYHHLFDPATGIPGRRNRSATVVGDDPRIIDAAVKVAFLLPADSALNYLRVQGLPGLMVDSSGAISWSAGLGDMLELFDTGQRTMRR